VKNLITCLLLLAPLGCHQTTATTSADADQAGVSDASSSSDATGTTAADASALDDDAPDAAPVDTSPSVTSCEGICGVPAAESDPCACDAECIDFDDCCDDYYYLCDVAVDPDTTETVDPSYEFPDPLDVSELSYGDCRGWAGDDPSYCDTDDCRGIARGDSSYCDTADCRGIASGSASRCGSKYCQAIVRKDPTLCPTNSADCRALATGNSSACDSDQCDAIVSGSKSSCPSD